MIGVGTILLTQNFLDRCDSKPGKRSFVIISHNNAKWSSKKEHCNMAFHKISINLSINVWLDNIHFSVDCVRFCYII